MKSLSTDFSKKYIIVFSLVTLSLLFLLEFFLRSYIVTIPKSIPNIIEKVYEPNTKVVVIGDSHFYRGFVGSDDVLNLSKGGFTIPVIYEIFKHLPDKKGKKIIFEASPQMFSKRHLEWGVRGFDQYFVLPSFFKVFLFEPGITQYLSTVTTSDALKKVLIKDWPNDRSRKSSWELIDIKEKRLLTESRVELHQPLMNTKQAALYKQLFEKMIIQAIKEEMELCLLRTPVDANYLELINNNKAYNDAIKFFKDLATTKNIRYVDFRDLSMNFDFEQFINQDHLTPDASKQFVPLVIESCGF